VFFLGVAALWIVALRKWDRKRPAAMSQFSADPLAAVRAEEHRDQVLPVAAGEAQRLARAAIERLGGRDITAADTVTTGWVGSVLTNIPGHGEYQLIVVVADADGGAQVRCAARPRFTVSLLADAGARRWRARLASELQRAAVSGGEYPQGRPLLRARSTGFWLGVAFGVMVAAMVVVTLASSL
jgi:hypothetical protein